MVLDPERGAHPVRQVRHRAAARPGLRAGAGRGRRAAGASRPRSGADRRGHPRQLRPARRGRQRGARHRPARRGAGVGAGLHRPSQLCLGHGGGGRRRAAHPQRRGAAGGGGRHGVDEPDPAPVRLRLQRLARGPDARPHPVAAARGAVTLPAPDAGAAHHPDGGAHRPGVRAQHGPDRRGAEPRVPHPARASGRVRADEPPARGGGARAAARGDRAAVPRPRLRHGARRRRPAREPDPRGPGEAQALLRPPQRHGHGRQLLSGDGWRGGAAAGRRRGGALVVDAAAGPAAGLRVRRAVAAPHGAGAGVRDVEGAGPRTPRPRRLRALRDQRGLRRPGHRLPRGRAVGRVRARRAGARPRAGDDSARAAQRQRRRSGARAPGGRERRAPAADPAHGDAAAQRAARMATLCVGGGQGAAFIVERDG